MFPPQFGHGLGSCIFMPTIGEDDGNDDGGDEDSKRSSCNMDVARLTGHHLRDAPAWDYVRRARDDVIPSIDGLGPLFAKGCRGRCFLL